MMSSSLRARRGKVDVCVMMPLIHFRKERWAQQLQSLDRAGRNPRIPTLFPKNG
jgi:hypothetical protein